MEEQRIYNYHPVTRQYIGEGIADIDPLESEKQQTPVWLIPASATILAPPAPAEGNLRVFDEAAGLWGYVLIEAPDEEPEPDPQEPPPPTGDDVDAERDRRIALGFYFNGVLYQLRADDRENIAGAKAAATDAVTIFRAQPGDYGWQQLLDPTAPAEFRWIAADNSETPMDAQTAIQFGYAAMTRKQALIFAARSLKNVEPIPADFIDDKYWPSI